MCHTKMWHKLHVTNIDQHMGVDVGCVNKCQAFWHHGLPHDVSHKLCDTSCMSQTLTNTWVLMWGVWANVVFSGSWGLRAGSWELGAGSWELGAGSCELVAGSWDSGTLKSPMWVKRGVQNHRKSSFLGACSRIWGLFLKSISKLRFWTTFSGKGS